MLHLEPDFWGYAEQVNEDPTKIPAAVASANPTDCKSLPNTVAGMGACLVAMTRTYAPNTKLGLHASSWGTKVDVLLNTDTSLDVAAYGKRNGVFLNAVAPTADFIVVDAGDRDAGFYKTQGRQAFWDDTNKNLPNFKQAFAWAAALSASAGKPVFWWQVPVGNMSLPNVTNRWQDNRLDYFFAHQGEVAATGAFAFVFGAGAEGQTTFESDGGNAVAKIKAYRTAGGRAPCP